MSVEERLYPPLIGSSIPAFYREGQGAAHIAVPFAMNRAVSVDQIGGFQLKIKTAQTNTELAIIDSNVSDGAIDSAVLNRIVDFYWQSSDGGLDNIKVGQYLKIQLAYKDTSNVVGYFSTVAIAKYTSQPKVSIEGLGTTANQTSIFKRTCIGIYELTDDKSERPYTYNFSLYDYSGGLVETSGWLLHNTTVKAVANSLSVNKTIDSYDFKTVLPSGVIHYVQYS